MAEQLVKKEWTEPELIVLVRSNPEEAVLGGCKREGITGVGLWENGCYGGVEQEECFPCDMTILS